jgi:N-acetylglutamate synthase-like GNAT family acetyltransferase
MVNSAAQHKMKEKEAQAFYNTTKALFDDMGFQEADVKEAVLELCNRGWY